MNKEIELDSGFKKRTWVTRILLTFVAIFGIFFAMMSEEKQVFKILEVTHYRVKEGTQEVQYQTSFPLDLSKNLEPLKLRSRVSTPYNNGYRVDYYEESTDLVITFEGTAMSYDFDRRYKVGEYFVARNKQDDDYLEREDGIIFADVSMSRNTTLPGVGDCVVSREGDHQLSLCLKALTKDI